MVRMYIIFVFFTAFVLAPNPAYAQTSIDLRGGSTYPGGSLIPGYDSAACDSSSEGAIRYNSGTSCIETCDGTNWTCIKKFIDSCPAVGDTCADGSIFAGLSPDGQAKMYTTPADALSNYPWNNGNSSGYVDTTMVDCTDSTPGTASSCQTGEADMAILVAEDSDSNAGGVQPHQAAAYCDGLSSRGHSDWYLPAQDELNVLYTNKNTGALNGTFDETGSFPAGYYWSSSEDDINDARRQRFNDGFQSNGNKDNGIAVRCVRKGE